MQVTRERILNIMKERTESTVEELSTELGLTPVTVRHHIDILRGQGLVTAPVVRRRKSPGRPQYAYSLTHEADEYFPKKYDQLVDLLLSELATRLPQEEIEQMLQTIGERLAKDADVAESADLETRLTLGVEYLNTQGYLARWEPKDPGQYFLHIANCPFEKISARHPAVCRIDATMLASLLDAPIRRVGFTAGTEQQCTYIVASSVA